MDNKQIVITVIGSGYVGLTTSVLLANCGYKVFGLEVNPDRLNVIKQGKSFFYEEGLDNLVSHAVNSKQFIPTDSYQEAIPDSDIIFSCVGTPDNADGSSNLSYVFSAAEEASRYIKPGAIFVQKSTVPVGTGNKIIELFKEKKVKAHYVSNPEFLREGTAIADTLWFDRVIVGTDNETAAKKVTNLYRSIEGCQNKLMEIAQIDKPKTESKAQYFKTTLPSAELIKVSANAFLAMKITFANSIAKLADQTGANIKEVMDGVGSDNRIGRSFLNAGRGFGGGCFPKDVSGLIRSANDYGVGMEVMEAVTQVNSSMPNYIIRKAEDCLRDSLKDKSVAVLGLAFKAGTSDVRKSQAVVIANTLSSMGARVKAHDPKAMEEAKEDGIDQTITLCENASYAVEGAECVFIATDWPEFNQLELLKNASRGAIIVDCMNMFDKRTVENEGFRYIGVGI